MSQRSHNPINHIRLNEWRQVVCLLLLPILLSSSAAVTTNSWAASTWTESAWKVKRASEVRIEINPQELIREDFDPSNFFGFNLNYFTFQLQLWDDTKQQVRGDVVSLLKEHFPGSRYRYPGGMVANGFSWRGAVGPVQDRAVHRNLYGSAERPVTFGLKEYFQFLEQTNGDFWYVLNLVGSDPRNPWKEDNVDAIADNNQALAQFLKKNPRIANTKRYFQLGNELDRSKYEWSHQKYASRARTNIDKILQVDADAQFIAFLREFKYRYNKDKSRGRSHPEDLMADVLAQLPEVNAYSLMQYYDGLREDGKNWSITFWLTKLQESIAAYKKLRNGAAPQIWITEHSRQASSSKPGSDNTKRVSSNLGGAISTADYLTAMVQIPEVAGTFWHGLNAGPWQLFDANVEHRDYRPRPIFWVLAALRNVAMTRVFHTITHSPNKSGYKGGYDVRAASFGDPQSPGRVGMWVVNRAQLPVAARTVIAGWAGRKVRVTRRYLAGRVGVDADDESLVAIDHTQVSETEDLTLSDKGEWTLALPPTSVTALIVEVL